MRLCIRDTSGTISVMNDELQQQLDSLARDECYRVDAVLKNGQLERTERVFFVGQNGSEQGPYVRKYFDCEAGLGGAYRRILDAQRQGARFLHLPRIFDCYSVGEQDAVVMECVPGKTLADVVYECDPSVELAKRLFPPVCDAICELHERFNPPLIHRDIKPSNFMVKGNAVFVIDLGIARTFDADATTDTKHFGTRAYAPPEQFGYGQTDERSDVYALGMLLFYLLCEETPEVGCVEAELEKHGVSDALRSIVAKAASFDPANRYQSVTELCEAFRATVAVGEAEQVPLTLINMPNSGADESAHEAVLDGSATLQREPAVEHLSAHEAMPRQRLDAAHAESEAKERAAARDAVLPRPQFHNDLVSTDSEPASRHFSALTSRNLFTNQPSTSAVKQSRVGALLSRVPFGLGVAWDIVLSIYVLVFGLMCLLVGFFGTNEDLLNLPRIVIIVEFVFAFFLFACPVPLLMDTRPIRRKYPKFGPFPFRMRLLVFAAMLVLALVGITLIGSLVIPNYQ